MSVDFEQPLLRHCLPKIHFGSYLLPEVFQNKKEYIVDDNKDVRVYIDYILRLEQTTEKTTENTERWQKPDVQFKSLWIETQI